MSVQPLFTPVRMGEPDLPNRIVMAPLTRMRAGPIDHVPTALQAEYYAQRASAGRSSRKRPRSVPQSRHAGRSRTIIPIVPRISGTAGRRTPP